MASIREIKKRRESIESTGKITKAMKLVATVKLKRARTKAESAKPYTDAMYKAVREILASTTITHPYLTERDGKTLILLMTSNRGLAGGYNHNVIAKATKDIDSTNTIYYTFGRKGQEFLKSRGYTIYRDNSEVMNEPLYKDAIAITEEILKMFRDGEISRIELCYTEFKNTVSYIAKKIPLLPVPREEVSENQEPMNFESDDEDTLNYLVPQYITSLIYGAFMECMASENGARMTAMEAATDNADEMIQKLSLQYNRARQGSITQELTEIVAGSRAIS